jgi:hypothetical protein
MTDAPHPSPPHSQHWLGKDPPPAATLCGASPRKGLSRLCDSAGSSRGARCPCQRRLRGSGRYLRELGLNEVQIVRDGREGARDRPTRLSLTIFGYHPISVVICDAALASCLRSGPWRHILAYTIIRPIALQNTVPSGEGGSTSVPCRQSVNHRGGGLSTRAAARGHSRG